MLGKKLTGYLDDLVRIAEKHDYQIDSMTFYNTYAEVPERDRNQDTLLEMEEYLSGKNIRIVSDDVETEYDEAVAPIEERIRPFDPTKINITMAPMALESLVNRLKNEEIDLKTFFQRRSGLWSDVKKSQLIESLLLRIPLPAFYFDACREDEWLIIDGLQRITAFNEFIVEKTLKLSGMEFFTDLNDMGYDELPRQFVRRLDESSIITYTIKEGTPQNVKYNIFKRLNTGGMELEAQEIRHALYHGQAVGLLKALSSAEEFLDATCHSIRTERMLDQEFALRFIAVCYYGVDQYAGSPEDFLNDSMDYINKLSKGIMVDIEKEFRSIMHLMVRVFGNHAFRKMAPDGRRRPINKAIYEVWCKTVYDLDGRKRQLLSERRDELKKKFIQLCERPDFIACVKSSDRNSFIRRMNMVKDLVEGVVQ